jgi:cytochrome P450
MEEVFRLESPVQNNFRVSTRATTLAGVEIPAYTRIAVMIGSANRDPRVFPDPERIDPTRENVREHLAFGQGNHYCIGAGLARLEGTIALNVLLDRLKNVRFTPGQDALRHNPIFIARALTALHIDFDA